MSQDGIRTIVDNAGALLLNPEADAASNAEFMSNLHSWVDTADTVTLHSLLPLAITGLIIHELWTTTQEGRAFRGGWVLLRIAGFCALLIGYGRVVGLLTGILGGASAWPTPADMFGDLTRSSDMRMSMLEADTFAELPHFMLWVTLFIGDCITSFFAFAALALLTKFQAVMIIIFIAAGKTCIVLSLVPGVAIAKSWAKALATVAAWGWMGGLVLGAVGHAFDPGNIYQQSAAINIGWHARLWLYFVMLGLFSLSIPKFVSSLISGAVSGAPSIMAPLGAALLGGALAKKLIGGAASVSARPVGAVASAGAAAGSAVGGAAARTGGKVARTAGGVAAGAAKKVVGPPARRAALAMSIQRGAGNLPGRAASAAPSAGAIVQPNSSPREASRAANSKGSWDVAASEKSAEQWKADGWHKLSGPALRPPVDPSHTQHRVTSGYDSSGADQYGRWVQVPNKVVGPRQPQSGEPGQALDTPGQVRSTAYGIARSAASASPGLCEPAPSAAEINSAMDRADVKHASRGEWGASGSYRSPGPGAARDGSPLESVDMRGTGQAANYVSPSATTKNSQSAMPEAGRKWTTGKEEGDSTPSKPRRGGKQERS